MRFRPGDIAAMPVPLRRFRGVTVRMCERKYRNPTEAKAVAKMQLLYEQGRAEPGTLHVYECPHCDGGWHVGHRTAKRPA